MQPIKHVLEVWGDFACFTIPSFGKVERYSYPIITPSAARSIFRAIYWKPNMIWQVRRVDMLSMPKYIALRRNEIKGWVPSEKLISRWMKGKAEVTPIMADDADDPRGRTQRQTMALKDVRYRLYAEIYPWDEAKDSIGTMNKQFVRRARKGQCIFQPYLGCREFAAFFRLVERHEMPVLESAVSYSSDLGWIPYDSFDLSVKGNCHSPKSVSVFHAGIYNGRMDIPLYTSDKVRKSVKNFEQQSAGAE